MKVIIQIPCYNEEESLPVTLQSLPRDLPAELVPDNGRILQVMCRSFCSGIPSIPKQRFPCPPPDWEDVLYGDPKSAALRLRNAGYDFFYFDLSTTTHYFSHAFSPVFEYESLIRSFDIYWQSENEYLLTWKSPDGKPVNSGLASAIQESIQKTFQDSSRLGQAYLRHKRIRDSGENW